jgi:ribonuclease VapC
VIIDSSALVALLLNEDDADTLYASMVGAQSLAMSAATYVETGVVVDARPNPGLSNRLDRLLSQLRVDVVPVSVAQAKIARQAYRDFGKASGHPARLNFGDCFAYALAIDADEPLLFKGDDFTYTDVRVAVR